jgi:hypothetical protein
MPRVWDPDIQGPCAACGGSGERVVITGKDDNGKDIYERVDCPKTMTTGGYVDVPDPKN